MKTPYRLRLEIDLPLLGLGLAGALMVFAPAPPPECLPDCDPSGINPLDRLAVGGYSAGALLWANALLTALCLGPVALELAYSRGRRAWPGLVVFAVAMALTQVATQLTKFAVRRPAPFTFTPEATPESALLGLDAGRSFISGHTATAFVAATILIVGYWLRRPDRTARWWWLAVAGAAAAAVGVLKVVAGYHYWTDVLAGALVGSAVGVLVAVTHRRPS